MSEPTFINKGGSYLFDWQDEKLQIEVSKIRGKTDGSISCVVTATTNHPDFAPHLYQINFNPLAPRTKTELSKELQRRYNPNGININWDEVIETLCVNTIEQYESGEPVEEVWSTAEWTRPGYLLYPIIPLNKPTIIFGDPGSGKSEIALMLGIVVFLPLENNKLNLIPRKDSYLPLILDYEADKSEIGWRLKALQEGMDLPLIIMNYRRCYLPFAQDVGQIQKHIIDTKSDFIIIDSLGPACGGELKDAGPALSFFSALRQLKTINGDPITSLVIAHTAKNSNGNGNGDSKKTIYGSMFFEAISRSVWEVNGDQQEGADDINVSMKHTKANMSKKHGTLGFNINFSDNKTAITAIDPKTVAGLVERMGANTKILQCLKEGPKTNEELATMTGIPSASIYTALSRLKEAKRIIKVGKTWGLITNAQN